MIYSAEEGRTDLEELAEIFNARIIPYDADALSATVHEAFPIPLTLSPLLSPFPPCQLCYLPALCMLLIEVAGLTRMDQ